MQETEPMQENTGNEVHGGGGDPDRKLKPMQGNVGNVHIYSGGTVPLVEKVTHAGN